MPKTSSGRNKRVEEPTIPLSQCKTVHGSLVSTLGAALPFITVELGKWPPSTLTRVSSLVLGVVGFVLVGFFRSRSDHPKVKGLF
jgi:hypothetical protein